MTKTNTGRFSVSLILTSMLILSAVIPPVNAATGWLVGQIIGKDIDNQDIPLMWANVTVYKNGVPVASVSPGFDGTYSTPLPAGFYVVSVDHIGFNGSSQLVSIRDWYVTEADFRLDRAARIAGDVFDFSLSCTSLVNIPPGELGWARIQVTLCCGPPQAVNLTVSGVPANASVSINPSAGRPSYAGFCLITTTAATPMGSYNVTVTGVGGGMSHNATFTLTIST